MTADTGFASIGEARLYYELAGEGQPLILIHAGVADSRQWDREFVHFARDFRVLRYDLRGYGKSEPVEGAFSHLGDLAALLEQLGFDQPLVLLGCSMGGGLAMDFALENPSRVKALVMVASGPSGLELDVPRHPRMADAVKAYNAGDMDLLAEIEAQIWFDGMGRTPEQVNPEMRALAVEMNRLALQHESKKLGDQHPDTETPAVERLDQLRVPLLVIVGEHDIPYAHAAADHVVERIPSARKTVLADAAHLPNMDHPEVFQRAVRAFLDEVVG